MSNKFTIEIITPDRKILDSEASEVTVPSYEGQMGILKDHIPLITFLRPGFIIIKNEDEKKYYVEEGTLVLTSSIKDLENFDTNFISELLKDAENKIQDSSLSDKEQYIASHKISSLKEIN
mgnify:CR=1 FL=1